MTTVNLKDASDKYLKEQPAWCIISVKLNKVSFAQALKLIEPIVKK